MTAEEGRSVFEYLTDIVNAIDRIKTYTNGLEFESFAASRMLVDAVLYNFVVIGEVAAQLRRSHPQFAAENVELALTLSARLRNFIVHEYFRISLFVIWQTIVTDLPSLRESTLRVRDRT